MVVFVFADALDMDLSSFAELATVLALSHWTALFLDLKKGTVGVLAGGGAVALDAGLAVGREWETKDD